MKYSFNCYGHENITAKHKTTLEFTKDKDLNLNGDCIVGVSANFELSEIKEFIKKSGNKFTVIMRAIPKNKILQDEIIAEINPDFSSNKEIVIRKTDFVSERTMGIKANKAAFELNRGLINFLKEKKNKIRVIFESKY